MIDLLEGFIIMEARTLFFFTALCYSVNSIAAFNSNENKQLAEIDLKSRIKVTEAVKLLDKAVNDQIINNQGKKKQILALRESWDLTVQKKCQLENFYSIGTDAEISATNDCYYKGYQQEIDYFKNMLP